MAIRTLVMYEISQKQKYIFKTNRLIENIGASTIIRQLTEEPHTFLKEYNVELPQEYSKIVGGGNATYIFDSTNEAMKFAKSLTKAVLQHFPGVELFLVQREVDWQKEIIYDQLMDEKNEEWLEGTLSILRHELEKKKNQRRHAVQQISWGIQQICSASGLPADAEGWDQDEQKIVPRSKELVVKEKHGQSTRDDDFSKKYLSRINSLKNLPANVSKLAFLEQKHFEMVFGEENQSEERKSYVAIVHIDGNAMGKKVGSFKSQKFTCNDKYIEEYAKFTKDIDGAYTKAMICTIEHIMNDYPLWAEKIYGTPDKEDHDNLYKKMANIVPLRPIVASGDDICFITYGQLGIEAARVFIQYLQNQSIIINKKKQNLEACAGVAIVRHKFPFWLAYELAEKLCANAKKRLSIDACQWSKLGYGNKKDPFDTSLIDWHIVTAGDLQTDIAQIRQTVYQNADDSYLTNRPYYLQRNSDKYWHEANYMSSFLTSIDMIENPTNFQLDEQARSKWKALREIYHQGKQAIRLWQVQNQFDIGPNQLFIPLKNFDAYGLSKKKERKEDYVAYFYDALEIMDYFVRLSEVRIG